MLIRFLIKLTDCFFWAFFYSGFFCIGGLLLINEHPIRCAFGLFICLVMTIFTADANIKLKGVNE